MLAPNFTGSSLPVHSSVVQWGIMGIKHSQCQVLKEGACCLKKQSCKLLKYHYYRLHQSDDCTTEMFTTNTQEIEKRQVQHPFRVTRTLYS